ncbi:response regulator transcription factor [Microbacterium esteraromaticum]|uniref:Response regulator transcription factor n=1 Tax=Microbacterium esteraromaticum TaxID=57043 RepID=A0A7D7WG93_9MICO|nr:response regulator transcription factor [Microbacterium esteraromaticum]QMU96553.1 response regulator transcription factor [Microbacterium esteraromaticum]
MIRVLLVDDHAMLRAGFRAILGTQPDIEVVAEAATGAEGVSLAAELQPDVITMDVQMPDMDGIEATRRIVADPSVTASVAIVTTFDRDEYLFQALDAGAGGFLLKNAGPEELITAVRALAAGDGILAPEVTRRVLARFSAPPVAARPSPHPPGSGIADERRDLAPAVVQGGILAEPLTDRESEVLALMADARSNAEIAGALFIGEATVKTHVSRVLQKLGARDRVQAIVLAHRHGLTR